MTDKLSTCPPNVTPDGEIHDNQFDCHKDCPNSAETQQQHWALVSTRDNVQLKIEARNSFVCFIGIDATSCEMVLRSNHADTTIDGRQAVLVYANGRFHIKDLNSSYGVSDVFLSF